MFIISALSNMGAEVTRARNSSILQAACAGGLSCWDM